MSDRWSAMGTVLWMVVISTVGVPLAHAGENRIQATASLQARARVFVTGPRQAFMLGAFAGRLAVEREPRTLDGVQLLCPAAVYADYAAHTQHGEGHCILTTSGGDRLFARWTCAGEPDKGCAGRFVLTGGTGAFQGVTGEGDLALRLGTFELLELDRQESEYDLTGTALWPGLTYRTP
jgi:hypothetical protein